MLLNSFSIIMISPLSCYYYKGSGYRNLQCEIGNYFNDNTLSVSGAAGGWLEDFDSVTFGEDVGQYFFLTIWGISQLRKFWIHL